MSKRKPLLAVFLSLILCLFMFGCGDDGSVTINTPTTPTPGTPSGTTTVRAFVYGANGLPIEGVTVKLTQVSASTDLTASIDPETTDGNGMVVFAGPFQGVYLIEAKDSSNNLLGSQQFTVSINDIINIFLGHVTGKLTVKISPEAVMPNVTKLSLSGIPYEFVTTSEATDITGSIAGDAIFYLPSGNYSITAFATGYNPVTVSDIIVQEGTDQEVTIQFNDSDEIPVELSVIEPRVCVNTGVMPATIHGSNFINPPAVTLIPVNGGTSITASDVVIIDENTAGCSFDLTGAAVGEYTVEINHSPLTAANTTDSYTGFWVVDTIQGGIDKANELYLLEGGISQVTAFVPEGNYLYDPITPLPVLPSLPLQMRTGVRILGAGTDTVIDGNSYGNIFAAFEAENLTIEGFTLTHGYSLLGGTILALGVGNMTVTDNVIYYNDALAGGGIFYLNIFKHAPSVISNNVIIDNYAGFGGGIATGGADCSITGNIIGNGTFPNIAYLGGGIAALSYLGNTCNIIGNVIEGNYAEIVGGGILCSVEPTSIINIRDNEITGNAVPVPASPKRTIKGDIVYDGEPGGSGIYFVGFLSDKSYINYNNIYGNTSAAGFNGQQLHYFYIDRIESIIDFINDLLTSMGAGFTIPWDGDLSGLGPAYPTLNGQYNWWGRVVDSGSPLTNAEVYPTSPKPGVDDSIIDAGNPAGTPYTIPEVPEVPAGLVP